MAFLTGQCKGKIEIFTFSGCWKSCNVAIGKRNCLCLEIDDADSHLPLLSTKKSF